MEAKTPVFWPKRPDLAPFEAVQTGPPGGKTKFQNASCPSVTKTDLKKELARFYKARPGRIDIVDVPPMNYLMVDGEGDPNTAPAYQAALEAMYPVAYTLKFMSKNGPAAKDYVVMPLEGLWWADEMSTFSTEDKSNWKWTLMILQPDWITQEMFAAAVAQVERKKAPASLANLRFETFTEGTCAQTLHVGPFSDEGPTIEGLHAFIEDRGQLSGKHHEIYLSDIRRAAPENWKTIIRQPMT